MRQSKEELFKGFVYVKFIILGILLAFFLIRQVSFISSQPFHIDEHEYIRKSYLFDYILNKDFFSPIWHLRDGFDQPSLIHFIYGASLKLSGIKDISDKLETNNFNLGWDGTYSDIYNQDNQWWSKFSGQSLENPPNHLKRAFELIIIGRITSAVFTIGSLILIFAIGNKLSSYCFGLFSVLIFGFHHSTYTLGRTAIGDSILVFFLLGAIYSITNLIQKKNLVNKKLYFSIALTGLFAGLAASTKLNGFMVLLPIISYLYLLLVIKNNHLKEFLITLAILFSIPGLIFFITNPFLYSKPIQNFVFMFLSRVLQSQSFKMHFSSQAFNSPLETIIWLLSSSLSNLAGWLLFTFSLFLIMNKVFKEKSSQAEIFILILFTSFLFSMSVYIPVAWPRYFYPLVIPTSFIQAYGLNHIFMRVIKRKVLIK